MVPLLASNARASLCSVVRVASRPARLPPPRLAGRLGKVRGVVCRAAGAEPTPSPEVALLAGDGEAAQRLLLSRRTVNDFLQDAVAPEVLAAAVEAARWAPNHRITEPWRFYFLGPETAGKVAQLNADMILEGGGTEKKAKDKFARWSAVPGWVLVTSKRSPGDELKDQEDYAATACAIHQFTLSLWGAGVGVKWTTGAVTRSEGLGELVGVDWEQERSVGILWYGYPSKGATPSRRKLGAEGFVKHLP